MDMVNSVMWFTIAFVITAVISKVAKGRIISHPVSNRPLPPMVTGASLIRLLYTLLTKGFRAMLHDQYTKLGSLFAINYFGRKVTFFVGPEVSCYFFQGSDSEISYGNILEFTVPMFGKEVGHGVDMTTRNDQNRFVSDALTPAKLRCHVAPMLQEVQDYFAKWGQEGTVDIKEELERLLMLISGRCLLGKEVREKMFGEVLTLLHQLFDNGLRLTSLFFPYAPTLANVRRDKARMKLSELFSKVVRSRKISNHVEKDVLQNLVDSKYRDGRFTTEAEVTGLIISMIFAGKHTSSATSAWTGALLLTHPPWLDAAVEEQEQIIRKHGQHIDYNVLQEMDTMYCCIKETLRMHPPAPMFLRTVHKNFTVRTREGGEYEILSGDTIASPVLFNSNIPYIYKNPNVYDPERFGPSRQEDKVGGKFSYTAFGGGRHACVGENYAYMQIKVIWSHLLRNFELELVSPFPQTSWKNLVPEPKGKVMVSYKRRKVPLGIKGR
ncbi:hypothetical protein ACP4OV_028598 [Aristida adscensionis]